MQIKLQLAPPAFQNFLRPCKYAGLHECIKYFGFFSPLEMITEPFGHKRNDFVELLHQKDAFRSFEN